MIRAGECSRICFPLPHSVGGVILQTNLAQNIPGNYIYNFMEFPQEALVHAGRKKLEPLAFYRLQERLSWTVRIKDFMFSLRKRKNPC